MNKIGACAFTLAALVLLGGCTEAIRMRNPTTGETATCGPYAMPNGIVAAASSWRETQCINDYRAQGYVRAGN